MGVIKKQSIYNTIILYSGIILGYINAVLLFPKYLTPEQYGLTRILLTVTLLATQFSQFGMVNITMRFFPFFRNIKEKHKGFLFFSFLISCIGIVVVALLIILFKSNIIAGYSKNSPLFIQNFNYIFPFTLFLVVFNILNVYVKSLFKSIFPVFLREFFIRVINLIILIIFAVGLVDFETFLILYVLAYGVLAAILIIYIIKLKQFFILPNFTFFKKKLILDILRYGMFTLLSSVAITFLQYIDILMIGLYKKGLDNIALYTVAFFVASIILIPGRSIAAIATPVIAEAWKNNDLKLINNIYYKTSINQLLIGLLLFIGIWANIHNIMAILQPEYSAIKFVILYIGIAKLFDTALGINSWIITTSKYYRFDLVINICLIGLAIVTNSIFIPLLGIIGAAIATAITILSYNISKLIFIQIKYKMHPFSWKTFAVVLIATGIYFSSTLIPIIDNIYLDITIRSLSMLLVYVVTIYFFKISDDINIIINKYLGKIKKIISSI